MRRRRRRRRIRQLDGAHLLDRRHRPRGLHDGGPRRARRLGRLRRPQPRRARRSLRGLRRRRRARPPGLGRRQGARRRRRRRPRSSKTSATSTPATRRCSPTSSLAGSPPTRPTTTPSSSPTTAPPGRASAATSPPTRTRLSSPSSTTAIADGLERGGRRQARPARLRRLPHGHLRGRLDPRSACRPPACLAGARTRPRLGLQRLRHGRRQRWRDRRRARRRDHRRLRGAGRRVGGRVRDHPLAHRPHPDARASTRRSPSSARNWSTGFDGVAPTVGKTLAADPRLRQEPRSRVATAS